MIYVRVSGIEMKGFRDDSIPEHVLDIEQDRINYIPINLEVWNMLKSGEVEWELRNVIKETIYREMDMTEFHVYWKQKEFIPPKHEQKAQNINEEIIKNVAIEKLKNIENKNLISKLATEMAKTKLEIIKIQENLK